MGALDGIDRVVWKKLTHAYGPAGDVPEMLKSKRVVALDRFRGGFPEENLEIAAVADVIGAADSAAAEDVE